MRTAHSARSTLRLRPEITTERRRPMWLARRDASSPPHESRAEDARIHTRPGTFRTLGEPVENRAVHISRPCGEEEEHIRTCLPS